MKKIALFGGSFNPPHEGHFEVAQHLKQTLDVDEVWFLFSVNWQKDASVYASLAHRMEMGRIMARHYPDMPFVMSDIEEDLGTHITCHVLKGLREKFPEHHFTWVMGADNLASFHTWQNFDYIIENFPIAILDRPSYTDKAKASFTALTYPHLRVGNPTELAERNNGWCFMSSPMVDLSSSHILKQLRAGKTDFGDKFQDIADYIVRHGLYGIQAPGAAPLPEDALDLRHK